MHNRFGNFKRTSAGSRKMLEKFCSKCCEFSPWNNVTCGLSDVKSCLFQVLGQSVSHAIGVNVLCAKARGRAVWRCWCSSSMCCSALKWFLQRVMKPALDSTRWDHSVTSFMLASDQLSGKPDVLGMWQMAGMKCSWEIAYLYFMSWATLWLTFCNVLVT